MNARQVLFCVGFSTLMSCGLLGGKGGDSGVVPEDYTRIRVDCLGMVPTADDEFWTNSRTGTPQILWSDDGTVEGRRCDTFISPATVSVMEVGEQDFVPNLKIHAFGQKWVSTVESEGTLIVDQAVGDWYFRGQYSTQLWAPDGTKADFNGWIDYCDQTQHPECPYTIANVLPYTFETSHYLMNAWGEANDCRAIIDPATGALQVDVSTAVWNGINISQLYRTSCPEREDIDPTWYGNRMTFKAGGVTGPGKYGPFRVTDFGGTQLPSLSWDVPPIFVGQANRVQMHNFYQYCSDENGAFNFSTMTWSDYGSSVGVNSQCSFEITEGDPGNVSILCTEVRNDRLIPTEKHCQWSSCTPDCDEAGGTCGQEFEWSGACEIITRASR
mgnify:CR=1 FL=1